MPEEQTRAGAKSASVENATSSAFSSPDLSGEEGDVGGSFVLVQAAARDPKEISVGDDDNAGDDYEKVGLGGDENPGEGLEDEGTIGNGGQLGLKIENGDEVGVNGKVDGEEGAANGEDLGANGVHGCEEGGENSKKVEENELNCEEVELSGSHSGKENVESNKRVEESGSQGEEGVVTNEEVEVVGLNGEERDAEDREEWAVSRLNGEEENVENREEKVLTAFHGGEVNGENSEGVKVNSLQGEEAVANEEEVKAVTGLNRDEENLENKGEVEVCGLQGEKSISDSKQGDVNRLYGSEEDVGEREEVEISGLHGGEVSVKSDEELEVSGLQGENIATNKEIEVSGLHGNEENVESREELEVNELHEGKDKVENSEKSKVNVLHGSEESVRESSEGLAKDDGLHKQFDLGDGKAEEKNVPSSTEEDERKKNICVEAADHVGENRSLPSEEDEMKVEEGGDACIREEESSWLNGERKMEEELSVGLSKNQDSNSGVDEVQVEVREPTDIIEQCGKEDVGNFVIDAMEETELQALMVNSGLTAPTKAVEGADVEEALIVALDSKQEEDAESDPQTRSAEEVVIGSGEQQLWSATVEKGESKEDIDTEKATALMVEPESKLQGKNVVADHAGETEAGSESAILPVLEQANVKLKASFTQENPEIVGREIPVEMEKGDVAVVSCPDVEHETTIYEAKSSAQAGDVSQPSDTGDSEILEAAAEASHEVHLCEEAKTDELAIEPINFDADGSMKPEHVQDGEEKFAQDAEAVQDAAEYPSSSSSDKEKRDVYIILIPRLNKKEHDEERSILQADLNNKTAARDAVNASVKAQKVSVSECQQKWEAAKGEENLIRTRFNDKRKEIDNLQAILGRMKNASFIDDIDDKIQNMELMIQHETMPLKQEKQYLKEIKVLKSRREELLSNMGSMEDIQEAFEQRDVIEERLKLVKKEADSLKDELSLAEKATKDAWKELSDERQHLKDLQNQFQAAAKIREEAYAQFKKLNSEFYALRQNFYSLSDYRTAVDKFRAAKDIEGLRNYCSSQVESVMEMWNSNEEFRKLYVKSNEAKTIRRLGTLDGRAVGLNEKPPVLQTAVDPISGPKLEVAPAVMESVSKKLNKAVKDTNGEAASGITHANANLESKSKKSEKPSSAKNLGAMIPDIDVEEVEEVMKKKVSKEDEELARKEEEVRKEKAAAELKEQLRLDQIAKAKEAEERKKRKAERNQAKAEYKARKEAEEKEKKKAKKEKQKAGIMEIETASDAPAAEPCSPAVIQKPESKTTTVSKRTSRQVPVSKKYSKGEPLPPQLRNRSKREMQAWMWVVLLCLLLVVLFFTGNYISSSNFLPPNFGF